MIDQDSKKLNEPEILQGPFWLWTWEKKKKKLFADQTRTNNSKKFKIESDRQSL